MPTTNELLDDLRARFRASASARLEEMSSLIAELEAHRDDAAAMEKLARHFHGLAGLGATYGFPRISQLGDEGETNAMPLARHGGAPSDADLAQWGALVEQMFEEIRHGGQALPPVAPRREATNFEVLIVEDDADLAAYLAHVLDGEGMRVRIADSCASGFDALDAAIPGAMVVDVLLPDGYGYDIVESLRARPEGEHVGVAVISVAGQLIDKVRAIHAGADAFFDKPLDFEALVRRLTTFRERAASEPERVLIVEDEREQAEALVRIVGDAGYIVEEVHEPARLDDALAAFVPDLVLMDVNLPGPISGFDLVRYLRQSERWAALPVIFVTTESDRAALLESIRAGGDDHVQKPVDAAMLLSSIASRLERARTVRAMADRDGLTGLLTRAAFDARAALRLAHHRRASDSLLVVVLLDIDRFKNVNDSYGHATGDRVLASLGALLRRRLRHSDTIGRYGGDELAVLLDDVNVHDAAALMERVLDDLRESEYQANGETFHVTFSAGVAAVTDSMDAALQAADEALYAAKNGGRGCVREAGGG